MLSRTVLAITAASLPLIGATQPVLPSATSYIVPLTGQAQSNLARPLGGAGDLDGSGMVRLSISPDNRKVCYEFMLRKLATPLMAHIHRGRPLRNGPPVVTLFTGPGGELDGCIEWRSDRLMQIVSMPADYYVSVETTEFPDGALRGQLRLIESASVLALMAIAMAA